MATELHQELRVAVRDLCGRFPGEYWRKVDEARGYPEEFVRTLTEAGWLAALIPEEYGGSGLNIVEASIILEEINRSGGNSAACHAQVHHGHHAAAWLGRAETQIPAEDRQRRVAASVFCRHRAHDGQ
jgi:alkylation response protein AidB-like acyl-CoA dehydrogenase